MHVADPEQAHPPPPAGSANRPRTATRIPRSIETTAQNGNESELLEVVDRGTGAWREA
jgi:hypothetical protein